VKLLERLDMRAGISGEIIVALETKELQMVWVGILREELERYKESIKKVRNRGKDVDMV
jgi:hypothetical protein